MMQQREMVLKQVGNIVNYMLNQTIEYYNKNAKKYYEDTVNADMSYFRDKFLRLVKPGGIILDLGCGTGRDSKAFKDACFKIVAVDGSRELCNMASELVGQEVICSTFEEFMPNEKYDGIWACSSLLHISKEEIKIVVKKLLPYMNDNCIFYMSYKYGNFSGNRNDRFFADMTEDSINEIFKEFTNLSKIDEEITFDVRPGRSSEKWLNEYYIKRVTI